MGELAAAAEALQKWGLAFVAVAEAAVIMFLYRQLSAERAARITDINTFNTKILEIASKSIEADKANQHAVDLLTKTIEGRPRV